MVWILLGALVAYFAVFGVVQRRWRQDPPGLMESDAPGVPGLGEAPIRIHHRMGPSARPRRGRLTRIIPPPPRESGQARPGSRAVTAGPRPTVGSCGTAGSITHRLADAAAAFTSNARNPDLRRAQLSFLGAWTAEWAFTVALGIVAYRDGGATALGLVGLLRMLPSAISPRCCRRSPTAGAASGS